MINTFLVKLWKHTNYEVFRNVLPKYVCSYYQVLLWFLHFKSKHFNQLYLAITQLNKYQIKVLCSFNCTHFLCIHCPQTLNYKNHPKKRLRFPHRCPSIDPTVIIFYLYRRTTYILNGEREVIQIKTIIICDHCQASSLCFNKQKSKKEKGTEREEQGKESERQTKWWKKMWKLCMD